MGDVIPMKAADLRKTVLEAQDIQRQAVEMPEWGVTLWVRGMTAREYDAYQESIVEFRGKKQSMKLRGARVRLVIWCTEDEAGNRVFSDEDAKALAQKSTGAIDRLWKQIRVVSGMQDEEDDADEEPENPTSDDSEHDLTDASL